MWLPSNKKKALWKNLVTSPERSKSSQWAVPQVSSFKPPALKESLLPFSPEHSYTIGHTLWTSAHLGQAKNRWGKKERTYLGQTEGRMNTNWDMLKAVCLWVRGESTSRVAIGSHYQVSWNMTWWRVLTALSQCKEDKGRFNTKQTVNTFMPCLLVVLTKADTYYWCRQIKN